MFFFILSDVIVCVYLFPSCLFVYRDIVTVAKSFYRLSVALPSIRLVSLLAYISGHMTKMIVDSMGFDGSDFRVRLDNELSAGVLLYAVITGSYLDLRPASFRQPQAHSSSETNITPSITSSLFHSRLKTHLK